MSGDSISENAAAELPPTLHHIAFGADDVYKAIADGLIVFDLRNELLSDVQRSRVYRDEATLEFARRLVAPTPTCDAVRNATRATSIQPGHIISYGERSYTVTLVGKDHLLLTDQEGGSTELALSTLEALHAKGQVEISPTETTDINLTRAPFNTLSPDEIVRAVRRGRLLDLPRSQALGMGICLRTLQRWQRRVRSAGVDSVHRNLALVDGIRSRGNRERRLPEQIISLIERTVQEVYNQPTSVTVSSAYRNFVNACHESDLKPCSYRAFLSEIQARKSVRKREGKRSAYQAAPIVWYLHARDPIHGVRPFEYVHIDHTPLDIFLISGETKELLGKPWLSLAIDAESRAIVGHYLSFESPSYRSCMMVLRDIVRRYGRMPGTVVVDGGADFKCLSFQRVCELYSVTLRYRPAGQPRHGSVMERIFGTAHSQLVHNLAGNTKQLKNPRTVTKSVDPERHAQWTLPALYGSLDKYFRDIYGTELHPAHGEAPESHLTKRLAETGLRCHRLVRLDRTLLIETCPPVDRSGDRRVDVQRGVKVNHLWYWTDAFRASQWDGVSVQVRVDPWDARHCYVLLGKNWHQCVCKLASTLRRVSRIELESYFEEMTHRGGVEKRELTPERAREWIQVLDRNAFDSRLHAQQHEARLIYDALKLTTVEPAEFLDQQSAEGSSERAADRTESDEPASGIGQEEYELY